MVDRIRYERLANTAPYEHVSLSVDIECAKLYNAVLKSLIERADRYVLAIKRRSELERELAEARRMESWYKERLEQVKESGNDPTDDELRLKELAMKIESLVREQGEWLQQEEGDD